MNNHRFKVYDQKTCQACLPCHLMRVTSSNIDCFNNAFFAMERGATPVVFEQHFFAHSHRQYRSSLLSMEEVSTASLVTISQKRVGSPLICDWQVAQGNTNARHVCSMAWGSLISPGFCGSARGKAASENPKSEWPMCSFTKKAPTRWATQTARDPTCA